MPTLALVAEYRSHLLLPNWRDLNPCIGSLAHDEVKGIRFVGRESLIKLFRVEEWARRSDEGRLKHGQPNREMVRIDRTGVMRTIARKRIMRDDRAGLLLPDEPHQFSTERAHRVLQVAIVVA